MTTLILMLLLINGNFSDGLNHWDANGAWFAARGEARLQVNNPNENTVGALLCSEPQAATNAVMHGTASVWQNNQNGYVFTGARWYDQTGARLYDEMAVNNEGGAVKQWKQLEFTVNRPANAAQVSFCFYAGIYKGASKVRVDNAAWR